MGNSISLRSFVAIISSFILLGWFCFFPMMAEAQGQAGIGIQPAVYEEQLDPGVTDTFSLSITNRENQERELFVTPRNISGVSSGGRPIFTEDDQELTGYELASWLEFSEPSVVIPAGGTRAIEVTLKVPEDAPPGSHFGGINVTAEAPRLRESGAGIAYGVTNIVTVRVSGETDERAIIRSLSTDKYFYGATDVTFTATIENQGNVLIRPVGPLEIFNMFGQKVATETVNESLAGVFPRTNRSFEFSWFEENPGLGKYQAMLSLVYGGEGASRTMTTTVSFWILPLNIILPAAGALAVLLLLTYVGARLYVRRAISYHGAGRRLKTPRRQNGMPLGILLLIVMLVVTALFLLILLALVA